MAVVLEKQDLELKLKKARRERYACQSVAKKALPSERVSKCLRMLQGGQVEVWKHRKTEKAFYNGLMVCGSVWNCPVCAAKISERRRLELKQAFNTHNKEGGFVALLTLTFRHSRDDMLNDLLDSFSKATRKFMSGKRYQNIRDKMGMIGSIKVLEVTYSDNNGFHPHTHIALFYTKQVDLKEIKIEMLELWDKALNKFGLTGEEQYELSLEDGEKANDYLAKHGTWGLDRELSKSHIKIGKKGSLTPFDFLRQYLETENTRYLELFKEYAESFKGKRQVFWSQGLKKRFLIEEKSDEQLASEKVEEADLLGLLTYDQWKLILKHDSRANLLENIERFGFDLGFKLTTKKESSRHEDSHLVNEI